MKVNDISESIDTDINQVFMLDQSKLRVKNQGKIGVCCLMAVTNAIEYLLSKNNIEVNLSIYNAYLKAYFCANKLNPNNARNYRIIQPSCALNNYGQDDGFSIKNTIYGSIYGICESNAWCNIMPHVVHQPNFTFPFVSLNPLLTQDYYYYDTLIKHWHTKKFIKIVPKIDEKTIHIKNKRKKNAEQTINFFVKEFEVEENIYDNNLFFNEQIYKLKDGIFEEDYKLDNFNYTNDEKNNFINWIKKLISHEKKPILISLILPKEIDDYIDKQYNLREGRKSTNYDNLIVKQSTEYDDYHTCLMIGYDKNRIKILSSWGEEFGENGCFYVNNEYLFKKNDGKQLNCDLNQIYIISEVK
jgi:hypothetical protein